MALTITDTEITSDRTIIRARYSAHAAAGGGGAWLVNGQMGRLFTREQAIAAVQAAEDQITGDNYEHDDLEPYCAACEAPVGIFQGHANDVASLHRRRGRGQPGRAGRRRS